MIKHKVKCPRHFILKPGHDPYLREISPAFRKLPKWAFKKWDLPTHRMKVDRQGKPLINYNNFHQPLVTGAWAIEHCYDPLNWICIGQCKKRCFEGQGIVNTRSIARLNTR